MQGVVCGEERENYLPGRREREMGYDEGLRGGGRWCVEKTGEQVMGDLMRGVGVQRR